MLVAVIGGIHGNFAALESALSAIDDAGIHTILCTGNLVVGYDSPDKVVECITERRIHCVQGAWDRLVVRAVRKAHTHEARLVPALARAVRETHDSMKSSNIEMLRNLPRTITLSLEGVSTFLCYGSPSAQSMELREQDSIQKYRRLREAANAELIVCGSSGNAFSCRVDTSLFLISGRTGVPQVSPPTARFIVINTGTDPWTVEFPEVAYEFPSHGPQFGSMSPDELRALFDA